MRKGGLSILATAAGSERVIGETLSGFGFSQREVVLEAKGSIELSLRQQAELDQVLSESSGFGFEAKASSSVSWLPLRTDEDFPEALSVTHEGCPVG